MTKIFFISNTQFAKNYGYFVFLYLSRFPFTSCFVLSLNLNWYVARLNSERRVDFAIEEPRKNMEVDLHGSQSDNWVGNQMLARRSRLP